jgi:hypothetical protein
MRKLFSSLTVAAVVTASASAAVPPDTFDAGDLMIGFYSATENLNLVVNLGAYQQFDNRDGGSFSVSRLLVSDIASVYGANWNSRTDIVWTVTGATYASSIDGLTRNTIFASSPRASLGDSPISIAASTDAFQSTNDRSQIASIFQGYNTATTTVEGGYAVVQDVGASTVAFRDYQITTPTSAFGTFNDNDTTSANISDFYGLVPTSGGIDPSGTALASGWTRGTNYLGYFTLDSSGLSFTSAIPEPSTYAAFGGLAALGFAVMRRRRNQA